MRARSKSKPPELKHFSFLAALLLHHLHAPFISEGEHACGDIEGPTYRRVIYDWAKK